MLPVVTVTWLFFLGEKMWAISFAKAKSPLVAIAEISALILRVIRLIRSPKLGGWDGGTTGTYRNWNWCN